MYISSKLSCPELASKNRIGGNKEYKIECFIDDYLMPMLTSNYNNDLSDVITYKQETLFKLLFDCDDELFRNRIWGCDSNNIKWYIKLIKRNLMKLDDITLTFLINVAILKMENL